MLGLGRRSVPQVKLATPTAPSGRGRPLDTDLYSAEPSGFPLASHQLTSGISFPSSAAKSVGARPETADRASEQDHASPDTPPTEAHAPIGSYSPSVLPDLSRRASDISRSASRGSGTPFPSSSGPGNAAHPETAAAAWD